MMKIISWNVNGRVQDAARRQVQAILRRDPDFIALQEVRKSGLAIWQQLLEARGFEMVNTAHLLDKPYPAPPYPGYARTTDHIQRTYSNLIASKLPLKELGGLEFVNRNERRLAFPEKYLGASTKVDGREIEIHNGHVPPGSSRGMLKVHAYEAVRRRVDERPRVPKLLCADLNAPFAEDEAGPLPSGASQRGVPAPADEWTRVQTARWVAAEAGLLEHPNLRDAYRVVRKPGTRFPASHHTRSGGKRYDYVLASPGIEIHNCKYLTQWMNATGARKRLSDHAGVEVEFSIV